MVEHIQQVRETTSGLGNTVQTTREVDDRVVRDGRDRSQTLAARVVWYVAGVLLALLAIRFVLALLGANADNGFANFIYTLSHPFVAPFFSLFSYRLQYGVSRFEVFTLVAMAVYALIAYGIAKLLTISRHSPAAV